ncbi:MAG: cytochrome c [Gammaproteobacteria bacterium]|nr:cytochrome c [Gammaproteobacteria bacterium]
MKQFLAVASMLFSTAIWATDDAARARVDYALNCQGCHLARGEGFAGKVPRMTDFVGYYMHSEDGRAFLIQVPGVALSPLNDADTARLMNWMLTEFSAAQLPADYRPYTVDEVAALRRQPENDPNRRRAEVLAKISRQLR